jgi:D-threo-aldose 1-dehydrogenase
VVNAGVLNSGFLADPRIGARYDYEPTSDQVHVDLTQRIRRVCERHAVPLLAAAIQFAAAHPAVASVAVGAGTVAHAIQAFELYGFPIPSALWDELKFEGLIRRDAPVGPAWRSPAQSGLTSPPLSDIRPNTASSGPGATAGERAL